MAIRERENDSFSSIYFLGDFLVFLCLVFFLFFFFCFGHYLKVKGVLLDGVLQGADALRVLRRVQHLKLNDDGSRTDQQVQNRARGKAHQAGEVAQQLVAKQRLVGNGRQVGHELEQHSDVLRQRGGCCGGCCCRC